MPYENMGRIEPVTRKLRISDNKNTIKKIFKKSQDLKLFKNIFFAPPHL